MKKLFALVLLFVTTFVLAGCDALGGEVQIVEVEVPVIVVETEVVEIEVPTVITETEIQIVEVPIIIKEPFEILREIEVPVEVPIDSFVQFGAAYNDNIFIAMTRGDEAYIMEFQYNEPLIGANTIEWVQMEYQYLGTPINWVFIDELDPEVIGEDFAPAEVLDYYDAWDELEDLFYGVTFEEIEYIFQFLTSTPLEYEYVIELGVPTSGQLNLTSNYTDVYQLTLDTAATVEITIETNNDLDINFYHSSFIVYDYDFYETWFEGTSTISIPLHAGVHLLELENWYDFTDVSYTITIVLDLEEV